MSFIVALIIGAVGGIAGAIASFFMDNGASHRRSGHYNAVTRPDKRQKRTGRCDGDCANCPPHYGYRHGRWYYGHDHIEGCERGGNKGGGGIRD